MKNLRLITLCVLTGAPMLFGQASATINGRVTDQVNAAVPNAAVRITNAATGAVRQTVTNAEGLYSVPALVPGNYNIQAQFTGFSPADKNNVDLLTGANLTVDLQMSVSGVKEAVSVEAAAALVETSESTQGASISQTEVKELPMLQRSMGALISLIPGAREVTSTVTAHGSSSNYVSIGGGAGQNYDTLVDGIDNKEDQCGGTMINYNLDSIQELRTMSNGANAEFGKGTAQVLVATKSGTNQLHGSVFGYFRNQDLVRTDYFSDPAHGGTGKAPLSRNQDGGALGGRIIKDKLFFFASVEHTQQTYSSPRPQSFINELNTLSKALNLGLLVGGSFPTPSKDLLYTGKVNWQPTAAHSVYFRFSGEVGQVLNDFGNQSTALFPWQPYEDSNNQFLMDAAVGDAWVINPTTVNQFTSQWISFKHDNQYPPCPFTTPNLGPDSCLSLHLTFPSVSTGIGYGAGYPDWFNRERKWQWRDDLSKQIGRHAFKFGVDYVYLPTYGGFFAPYSPGVIAYLNDPSTIVGNLNGLYPQGFQTPGAPLYMYLQSQGSASLGVGNYYSKDNWNLALYGQDDWKISSRLTLNYGLRYDLYSMFNSPGNLATNPTYQALKAIGSPYGRIPVFPARGNIQPRIGIAWDVRGNGKDVFRLSFGRFYVEQLKNSTWLWDEAEAPQTALLYQEFLYGPLIAGAASPLAHFVYGVSALPSIPPISKTYPPGLSSSGYWYDPSHSKDASSDQYHIGWSHVLPGNSVIALDHTDILLYNGWRNLDINPSINGVRPLEAQLAPVIGANALAAIIVNAAVDHARYDETVVHYEKRFSSRGTFQVNYVLAWSSGMGACGDGTIRCGQNNPQTPSITGGNIYAPWESGPTPFDERHRITAVGVLNLPFKIELAPSMTFATARPYTLYSGANPDGDGNLMVKNASGNPIGLDSQRGSPLFVVSTRVSRIFKFGADGRYNLAAFGELYNLTDRANFGNVYGGSQSAPASYEKPVGFLGGQGSVSSIPNSFQVQFGGRFTF